MQADASPPPSSILVHSSGEERLSEQTTSPASVSFYLFSRRTISRAWVRSKKSDSESVIFAVPCPLLADGRFPRWRSAPRRSLTHSSRQRREEKVRRSKMLLLFLLASSASPACAAATTASRGGGLEGEKKARRKIQASKQCRQDLPLFAVFTPLLSLSCSP